MCVCVCVVMWWVGVRDGGMGISIRYKIHTRERLRHTRVFVVFFVVQLHTYMQRQRVEWTPIHDNCFTRKACATVQLDNKQKHNTTKKQHEGCSVGELRQINGGLLDPSRCVCGVVGEGQKVYLCVRL